jgi:pyridoxine kinase
VITPNLTEACLLLDKKYPDHYLSKDEIKEMATKLSDMGPKKVAITSVMTDENHMYVAVFDRDEDIFEMLDCGYIKRPFHGTGDIFAAVLTGGLAKNKTMIESSKKAVDFIKETIAETLKYNDIKIEYGVIFEKALKNLIK